MSVKNVSALCAVLMVIGCSKASEPNAAGATKKDSTVAPQTSEAKNQTEPKPFAPKAPAQNTQSKGSDAVRDSYEKAARVFEPYVDASPGERTRILSEGTPLLQAALEASDARLKKDPNALNYRTVCKLDGRFSEGRTEKVLRDIIGTDTNGFLLTETLTYKDPVGADKTGPRSVSGTPARISNRASPAEAAQAALGVGAAGLALAEENAYENEIDDLLNTVIGTGSNDKRLSLLASDPLAERTKKVIVKAALDVVLGTLVSYKGSFFAAGEKESGAIEVWEFKQPVTLEVKRVASDERTRLNTGLELTATVEFRHGGENELCRRYANGFWGLWEAFPEIGKITITKEENWTVSFKPAVPFTRFVRLTESELDVALEKTTTTKKLAAIFSEDGRPKNSISEDEDKFLLSFFAAREEVLPLEKQVREVIERRGMNVTSASLAKRLATASLQALCERRPNLGATVKSGVGFTYFESYSEIKSENSEMHQSTAKHPKRGQKGHFYGEPYNLTDCVRAFRILALKDGADPDALYDLAILEEFSDTLPEDATHSVKEEAVKHLSKAIEVAETNPPSSRRDLKKLVIDTPTFIPLYMVNGFKPLASKLLPTPRNLPVQEPIRDPNNSAEVRRKRYFAAKAASEADEIRAGQYGKKYEREWSLYMGGY